MLLTILTAALVIATLVVGASLYLVVHTSLAERFTVQRQSLDAAMPVVLGLGSLAVARGLYLVATGIRVQRKPKS